MESQYDDHVEVPRSDDEEDLKQDDLTALKDPDTAALPDVRDDLSRSHTLSSMSSSCALKVLVSNNVAGSLIGKAGSSINDIQTETGARVKLSQANEFFPGTQYRVVLITGSKESVYHANTIVWDKITHDSEQMIRRPQAQAGAVTGRITIPNAASGLVIGRAGVTIRELSAESGARIQLSNKEESTFTQERMVSVTGPIEACIKCVELIVEKLMEDPKVGRYANMSTSYSRVVAPGFPYSAAVPGQSMYPGASPVALLAQPGMPAAGVTQLGAVPRAETLSSVHTIQMAVSDAYIGFVLGKNGSTITEVQNMTRARVTVSPRGEYVPGTTNRTVTITGAPMAANLAHYLIIQKLSQIPGAPISGPLVGHAGPAGRPPSDMGDGR